MTSLRQIKLAEKMASKQQAVIRDLELLAVDIERCEKTITDLQTELNEVNQKHQGPRTTQDDVNYLTDLLSCAKQKLAWEKRIASLQKRTPVLLENVTRLLNDPQHAPDQATRASMLQSLQNIQNALERLQQVKS